MHNDNTSINNQRKPQGKPIDAGALDPDTEELKKRTDKDGGMQETKPGPGNEAPGQVAKM